MSTFHGYCIGFHKHVDFEVLRKRTYRYEGHTVYILLGEYEEDGRRVNVSSTVTKGQYEMYDVPDLGCTECSKHGTSRSARKRGMDPVKRRIAPPKSVRHVHNEEIEKWILEHNGLDYNSLDDYDITGD